MISVLDFVIFVIYTGKGKMIFAGGQIYEGDFDDDCNTGKGF